MRRISALLLVAALWPCNVIAQTPGSQQRPPQEITQEDIIRISTELVQTDVVVMDKNEQPVPGLKLEDFELYENGRKQELHFMEFVSVDSPRRSEDSPNLAKVAPGVDVTVPRDLTAKELRRVMAFVVDDVTIPSEDMS